MNNGSEPCHEIRRFATRLFQDWPLDRAFAFAAECGYTGVEIAPFTLAPRATDISARRRAEIRRQADAAGLEVVGLHWLLAKTEGLSSDEPRRGRPPKHGRLSGRAGPAVRRPGRPYHGLRLAAAAEPRCPA